MSKQSAAVMATDHVADQLNSLSLEDAQSSHTGTTEKKLPKMEKKDIKDKKGKKRKEKKGKNQSGLIRQVQVEHQLVHRPGFNHLPLPVEPQPSPVQPQLGRFVSPNTNTHQQEPPTLPQTSNLRRSTRLAARQLHDRQSELTKQPELDQQSKQSHTPLPPWRAEAVRVEETPDPDVSTPRSKDRQLQKHHFTIRPKPHDTYLSKTNLPTQLKITPRSLLIVLDLNGVLVHRGKKTKYKPRPGLDAFLDYIFANHHVMIWSSGMPQNVEGVVEKLLTPQQRDKLVAIWSRNKLRIPSKYYGEKVYVYKQLSWIWQDQDLQSRVPGKWSQRNTVLIDDSEYKAAAEPFNLIEVDEYTSAHGQENDRTLEAVTNYLQRIRWYDNVSAAIRQTPFELDKSHDEKRHISPSREIASDAAMEDKTSNMQQHDPLRAHRKPSLNAQAPVFRSSV